MKINTSQKHVNVGVAPYEEFKKYTIAIAQGKQKPEKSAPKIWFHSMQSLANVLSEKNQALLSLIANHERNN